jgi:hypothetical protein
MNQARTIVPGLLLVLTLGMASCVLAADNDSPTSPPAANGTPQVATPPSPTLSDLGRSLRSYFTEEELDLLFQYMRDSVVAAFKGEEVTLPPDLSFKLEILLVRMKKEGGHYMDNLIRQLEKDLERNLKEKLKPPEATTSQAYTPPPVLIVPNPQPPAFQPPPYPQQPAYQPPAYQPPVFQLPQLPFFGFPFFQPPTPPLPQADP